MEIIIGLVALFLAIKFFSLIIKFIPALLLLIVHSWKYVLGGLLVLFIIGSILEKKEKRDINRKMQKIREETDGKSKLSNDDLKSLFDDFDED